MIHRNRLIILLVLLCPAEVVWGQVIVRVDPPASARALGAQFTVDIIADITQPVLGWGMRPILCHAQHQNVCSADGAIQAQFVESSLGQASQRADPTEVLETLACIATSEQTKSWVARGALRAIFHIAAAERRIQEHLLDIIRNPETPRTIRETACQLIVSVANPRGERELLRIVRDHWKDRDARPQMRALAELGSVAFLNWIEQTKAHADVDNGDIVARLASMNLEVWAKKIRLQHNLADLLRYIESDQVDIDRGWLVYQAVRHGVDRDKLRSAVLNFLRPKEPTQHPARFITLVRAADWYGVLTPDDAEAIEAVRFVRDFDKLVSREHGTWPTWATLVKTKQAEFVGVSP